MRPAPHRTPRRAPPCPPTCSYALGQLLLEKAQQDKEAVESMSKTLTFEERSYGAESLEPPPKPKGDGGDKKALEDKSGAGKKSSAKVAPA